MEILTTYTPATISRFLSHIRTANVPNKVTVAYLKSAGFKSSNDTKLIGIFKALGFLDQSGVPTELWKQYRGDSATAKSLLGQAVKKHYAGLFELYSDAERKDDEAIGNWIKANSSLGQDGVARGVRTFKTLAAEADFSGTKTTSSTPAETGTETKETTAQLIHSRAEAPRVNINIELQIPATDNKDIYDNFFAAMKKHLFDES
jgi:hypothetical protein